eukprot:COSAG01_NODE_4618_length_4876_cov_8.446305_3_plen_174_part_00
MRSHDAQHNNITHVFTGRHGHALNQKHTQVQAGCVLVRVEILGAPKCRNVGESQSVLIMIDPIIFTRTRSHADTCSPQYVGIGELIPATATSLQTFGGHVALGEGAARSPHHRQVALKFRALILWHELRICPGLSRHPTAAGRHSACCLSEGRPPECPHIPVQIPCTARYRAL